jgi:hypothetical protein
MILERALAQRRELVASCRRRHRERRGHADWWSAPFSS